MHQVRHIFKAHKADIQKPTLQKSMPCANAQPTCCVATHLHILDEREIQRMCNKVNYKVRADGSYLGLFAILLCLEVAWKFNITFCWLKKIINKKKSV